LCILYISNKMNECKNYEDCIRNEREQLLYPIDRKSLYNHRIYDNQTANRRCYERDPFEIIEGFDDGFSWDSLLKFVVIVLLVVIFCVLAKDLFVTKEILSGGNLDSPSIIGLTAISPFERPTEF
jgi:hypothetical protein